MQKIQIAAAPHNRGIQFIHQKEVERIDPYVVARWEQRIEYEEHTQQDDKQDAAINLLREGGWMIATTAVRNRHGCAYGIAQTFRYTCAARGVRIDPQSVQSSYTAELQAMAEAVLSSPLFLNVPHIQSTPP